MSVKNPKEYLDLPYGVIIRHITDESGEYYFATVEEMPGCMSDGSTSEEALVKIKESMALWIEGAIEDGQEVPLPSIYDTINDYSGKSVTSL
jgi:predicted RNase H-like HicB family nuclease